MDPLSLLLLVAALGAIAKAGVDHAAREYGKSRAARMKLAEKEAAPKSMSKLHKRRVASRHATGWWAREISRGFPFTRTGIHSGLLAHRTATDHLRARREEERTTHLETRGAFLKALPEHRKRQAAAQAEIDAALLAAGEPVKGKARLRTVLDGAVTPLRRGDGTPVWEPPAGKHSTPPAAAAPLPHETVSGRAAEGIPGARVPLPSELAAKPGGNGTWTPRPLAATHLTPVTQPVSPEVPGTSSPPMEGAPPMAATTTTTEATYTESMRLATRVEAEADAKIADVRWQQMGNHVDQLGALLRGNSTSLAAAAELADALAAEKKAAEETRDSAVALRVSLQREHGGIKEAADSSPAQMAEAQFYED